jgi:pimeloyl-ACP methyl ester carboxylesterase
MVDVHLTTADGVRLAARVLPGPGDVCVVLAHGFGVSTVRASVRKVARALARHATVLAYDSRGHGGSTGETTLGDLEVLDVDAAVAAARDLGHARVVTCGWSMGGAGVVRHAALRGEQVGGHEVGSPPDAVVAVSSTARWSERSTASGPLRRLHAVVETRPGRAYARAVMRARVATVGWDPLPASPVQVVHRVAPLPLLVLHGDADAYFPLAHPQALASAAREPVELWVEPGFGHAEAAASPELLDRLGRRVLGLVAS